MNKTFEDNNPSDSNISYINDTDNGTTIEKEKISYNSATTFLDKSLQLSDISQQVLNKASFEELLFESEKSKSMSPDRAPILSLLLLRLVYL